MGYVIILKDFIIIFLLLIIFFLLFYKLWFLRNPKLNIREDDFLVSPADGKISKLIAFDKEFISLDKGRFGKILAMTSDVAEKGFIICIAMNLNNVHYQIAPMDAKVEKVLHINGKFRNVFIKLKSLRFIDNERNEILLSSKRFKTKFKIKIIQVAGALAKRIICHVKPGQQLKKGDSLGLIKLGSMVVVILPSSVKLLVKEGQKIKVGKTNIAEFHQIG